MDVIAMHQAGFTNAVASLGTALTSGHASLVKRYTKEVLLLYDSDGAGIRAALRAIPILREAGVTSRVVSLKPWKDPDEFIKNEAGYVLKLQIGNVVMSGSEFAYVLGINSPNFSIEYMQTGVKITTIGVGEGFGVSVYTADCMAKAGSSYEDIIETFYNKINIISE